jgi:hypothetical protein
MSVADSCCSSSHGLPGSMWTLPDVENRQWFSDVLAVNSAVVHAKKAVPLLRRHHRRATDRSSAAAHN